MPHLIQIIQALNHNQCLFLNPIYNYNLICAKREHPNESNLSKVVPQTFFLHNLLGGLAKYLDHSKSLPNFDDSQLVPPQVNINFSENLHQKSLKKSCHTKKSIQPKIFSSMEPFPPYPTFTSSLCMASTARPNAETMAINGAPRTSTHVDCERWNLLVDGNWKKGGDLGMCVFLYSHGI